MGEDSAQSPPFTSEDILRENVSANSARLIPGAIASTHVTDRSRDGRLEIFPQGSWKTHRVAASVTLPQCLSSVTFRFRNVYMQTCRYTRKQPSRTINLLPFKSISYRKCRILPGIENFREYFRFIPSSSTRGDINDNAPLVNILNSLDEILLIAINSQYEISISK